MASTATDRKVAAAERARMIQFTREHLQGELRELMRKVPDRVLRDGDVMTAQRLKDWGASAAKAVAGANTDLDRLRLLISRYRDFEELGR